MGSFGHFSGNVRIVGSGVRFGGNKGRYNEGFRRRVYFGDINNENGPYKKS